MTNNIIYTQFITHSFFHTFSRILFDNQKVSFEENCENYKKMIDEYLSKHTDKE